MIVITECHVGLDDASVPFKKDIFRSIDYNVRNALLLEQQFQRTEAKCFVEDFFNQSFTF